MALNPYMLLEISSVHCPHSVELKASHFWPLKQVTLTVELDQETNSPCVSIADGDTIIDEELLKKLNSVIASTHDLILMTSLLFPS
jgi:hypothetical protein